ncbi:MULTISPECIES: GatB/YqeY domain-containing protein [unclassified Hahella]|uniref:GatB/YqeY domain-containing protein n=1 Tax=unclassified Hahella TaxID=2624107 RepID=UPI000FDE92ED|nr:MULTISPECIES: GatB/YqeY domain-containing protein [unclassified Hahella]AZZ94664.1 GatB/YqeY domain-containing protein [Hahella sp. KA22]MDG9667169.1 GatB/YqeY domain-containing protein [Hahella sp. CR1]QAY58037.1 GatB/YqeY domain-containing protein [Hahella sp. KA22]
MSLKDSLTEAMKSAMRSKEKDRLGAIRLILADIKRIEVDERIEVDDARVLEVLDKMAKQRKDSISQFSAAGRDDLVAKEQLELDVIQGFLPEALSEEELDQLIQTAVSESGAESIRDMGKVMAVLKPQVQGRADMAVIGQKVKKALS